MMLFHLKSWIPEKSQVLDLGCGDGTLLKELWEEKQCYGYGLEIDPEKITASIKKDINVIEQDLDSGLKDFDSQSFDVVVMSQTLQAVKYPDLVIDEMLRVGKRCIVSFPNFGHWATCQNQKSGSVMPPTVTRRFREYMVCGVDFENPRR